MVNMSPVILVVEDDPDLQEFLRELLQQELFTVHTAAKGTTALQLVDKVQPNLVILDLGLPDLSGELVCANIKKNYPSMPVIILTASDNSRDVVSSFERGADDYINKPFKTDELLARIKAKLRTNKASSPVIQVADLKLNTDTLEVTRNNTQIDLTQTEFNLLYHLMINKNIVLSRNQILGHVWAQDPDVETRVVDVYIGYLRKKIDKGSRPKLIHSKRGFGYVLKPS